MIRARIFRPARAGAEFLKLSASPFYFIGPRRSQRRGRLRPRARAPSPFVASRHFPRPAGESSPNPCRQRPFKGTTVPLKIPCWGALWPPRTRAVPFCRCATFPPHCGGIVPSPTAGFLGGGSKLIESQEVRSFAGKCCTLLGFSRIAQLPGNLFRLFRARAVRKPRSVTPLYFALTGQRGCPAWACGPMLWHPEKLSGEHFTGMLSLLVRSF